MSEVTLCFSLAPGRGLSDSQNGDTRPLHMGMPRYGAVSAPPIPTQTFTGNTCEPELHPVLQCVLDLVTLGDTVGRGRREYLMSKVTLYSLSLSLSQSLFLPLYVSLNEGQAQPQGCPSLLDKGLEGYLAHKRYPPSRTLQ